MHPLSSVVSVIQYYVGHNLAREPRYLSRELAGSSTLRGRVIFHWIDPSFVWVMAIVSARFSAAFNVVEVVRTLIFIISSVSV